MLLNGEAYVPPTCPALRVGTDGAIQHMEFLYDATRCENEEGQPIAELITQFYAPDDPDDDAKWTTVEMYDTYPKGSAAYDYSLLIADGPQAREMQARAREIMCDRVANCHGLVEGVCWALGTAAVEAINRQVVSELAPENVREE